MLTADCIGSIESQREGAVVGDTANFLYAALDTAACAPFFKERRMKFAEPTKFHR